MKVRIISNPITPYGSFSRGDILDSKVYPETFLTHLVNEAGAAEWMERETKIDDEYEAKKKPLSTQSLPQVKASQKTTAKKRTRKQKR